ncbi:MAG: hypothetical protein ACQETB_05665 [Halobacteriota archaeon]
MALEDIADGIEVTEKQRPRRLTVVDTGATSLSTILQRRVDDLPADPDTVERIIEAALDGDRPRTIATRLDVAPMVVAKTLHRCGVVDTTPLSAVEARLIRSWLDGHRRWSEVCSLLDVPADDIALARYVLTHPPIEEIESIVNGLRLDPEGSNEDLG